MQHRNLGAETLQVIFSVFLGLVVVAFVGITVNTIYPEPQSGTFETYDQVAWNAWRLTTGIWLLVCATLVMVAAMFIGSDRIPVIGNGILLGGVFTMIYAVGMALSAPNQWPRLAIVGVALLVTVGIGYWKFATRRAKPPTELVDVPQGASQTDPALSARIDALEKTLDGLRKALSD
jgi:hypothetical protein